MPVRVPTGPAVEIVEGGVMTPTPVGYVTVEAPAPVAPVADTPFVQPVPDQPARPAVPVYPRKQARN